MPGRTDQVSDPALAAQLLVARRGQAHFSRKLSECRDEELDEPSLVGGWSRSHVVAHVGLQARALTRLTEWAATGIPTPMHASVAERDQDVAFTATLPAQALRNLSEHAAVHLSVEWRDLPPQAWAHVVATDEGELVPVSETVMLRARELWTRAVDLGNGGSFEDAPSLVLADLLARALARWPVGAGSVVAEPTDSGQVFGHGTGDHPVVVRGSLAALTRWATGRGSRGVLNASGGTVPPATGLGTQALAQPPTALH